MPVEVFLLIGEKQRRLELDLVRQIHEHASKVSLIEVGASGRNALDLVLAWHLGYCAERHPEDTFFVVSKDRDYDPLIRHLVNRNLRVTRVESFSALPFLKAIAQDKRRSERRPAAPKAVAEAAAPEKPSAAPAARRGKKLPMLAAPKENYTYVEPTLEPDPVPTPSAQIPAREERLAKLIDRLKHRTKARPARRKSLLSHINEFFSHQVAGPDLESIVATLQERGILRIDPQGRVEYLH